MQKKILFIGHDASMTGAPIMLLQFLYWLRQNSDLDFELLLSRGGPILEDYQRVAPTVVVDGDLLPESRRLSFRIFRKMRLLPKLLKWRLRTRYSKRTFSLVYSNTVANGSLDREFASLGHRVICHAHEMNLMIMLYGQDAAPPFMIDCYIAAAKSVKIDLHRTMGVPMQKIEVVEEFVRDRGLNETELRNRRIQSRLELGLSENDIAVGMCGTVDWRKGADIFLQLALTVRRKRPRMAFRFIWIGSNPESAGYKNAMYDVKLTKSESLINFINAIPEPIDYFCALDIFTLTSREDPFPLAMLEAASTGVPIACFSSSGGTPEFVRDDAGVIVPYLDVDALADAVIALADDTTRRLAYGKVARARALNEYSLSNQAPKLLAIIERSLSAR